VGLSWTRFKSIIASRSNPKTLSPVGDQLKRLYQDTARRFGLRGRALKVSVKSQMQLPAHTEQEFLERIAVLIHALVLADDLDEAVAELKKLRDTPTPR
jgi:hypothetical protein